MLDLLVRLFITLWKIIFGNTLLRVSHPPPLQFKTFILKSDFMNKNEEEKLGYRILIAVEFQKPVSPEGSWQSSFFSSQICSSPYFN